VVLIYATNQVIGAAADELVADVRKRQRLFIDVRDQNWFLERANSSRARETAAEGLAAEIVDPFLASEGIIEGKAQALTSPEARAACVYLALQWEDDTRDKGLTRLCYEAMVRSVLRDTDSERRMGRVEVHRRVHELFPAHPEAAVTRHTDSALTRLNKRHVRHWKKEDEFCLTFEERQRIAGRLADVEVSGNELDDSLLHLADAAIALSPANLAISREALAQSTRQVLDRVLWLRGEVFASAVGRGNTDVEYPELANVSREVARSLTVGKEHDARIDAALHAAALSALTEPTEALQAYLRSFADAYTLFAFMRETPDVQAAVVKMFSTGEIWLDTTIVLPLFAEELTDDPTARRYTNLLAAARECGLGLYVTDGVLEELESHMRRCLAYARPNGLAWEGRVPFLAAAFALTGRSRGEVPTWLERYRGNERPEDDVAQYLAMQFGIKVQSLQDEAGRVAVDIRGAVQEVWHEAHERRRQPGLYTGDANTTARLVDHDVENYLGVVRKRRRERDSPLGYTTWWLTLDRTAYRVRRKLMDRLPAADVPSSPVLSPDFMVNFLAIGPLRNRIAKATESSLPLSISDLTPLDLMPIELLDAAEGVRERMKAMPEHVIQREVRDSLDRGRRRLGPLAQSGLDQTMDDLRGAVSMEQ
jgi:hypothetical protein